MEVTTYTLHPDRTEEDLHYLRQAIALSRRCTPCATSYRVGGHRDPFGRPFHGVYP